MNNLLQWPVVVELEIHDMCGSPDYENGRTAWFDDRPYDGLQCILWRRGWQDTEDLVAGMFAYDAGRPFDPKQSRPWREGWECAAESTCH